MDATTTYHGYFDGAAEPNPGHGSAGWHIAGPDGEVLTTDHAYLGTPVTNNEAEYHAAIRCLKTAQELGIKRLTLRGDSKLVINQLAGDWKVKNERMKGLWDIAKGWQAHFDVVQFEWVRRDANQHADDLSKAALAEVGVIPAAGRA